MSYSRLRFSHAVGGVGIACGPDHAAVVVEGQFVLQPVSQRALIERHVALEQLEIKRDVEAVVGCHCLIIVSGIDANSRCVLVTRRIDALVLLIFPLRGRLPEITVTVADVTIIDGHHLVAGDLDHGLLHDGAAQVLNHGPVRIFTNQRDSEGQAGRPWNDHVVRAEVRESNQQLLILINRARVVCNHDGLPHSFDP